jgi:nitric oxide reductase NorE protein
MGNLPSLSDTRIVDSSLGPEVSKSQRPAHSATSQSPDLFHPPGGLLIWMIVFLEVLTFGIGLIVFLRFKAEEPAVFRQGQAHLGQMPAWINTLVLLTGGWSMARAPDHLREKHISAARRGISQAAGLGVVFLIVKGWEYAGKLRHGLDLHHDIFHTMYWLLTGFHYLHVLVAIILLVAMSWGLRRGTCTEEQTTNIEASGIFWHLCDLIWLLLMPVLYLLP